MNRSGSKIFTPNRALALLLAACACACADNTPGTPDAAVAADSAFIPNTGGAPVLPDAAVDIDVALPDNDAGPVAVADPPRGIAVIASDYRSMSLSLINPRTGIVEKEKCVHSGSRAVALTQAFSGDVILPGAPLPGHDVVLIDRGNATLTWVDPVTCAVKRQVSVSTGFFANPQDVVAVGGKLFVSRYEKNATPTAAPGDFDEGSDILILDAATLAIEGRIDLSALATAAAGTVLPRPSRMVVVPDRILVVLNNLGPNFAVDEFGKGRVVSIDPVTRTVAGMLDIGELDNCSGAVYVQDPGGLLVSCNGNFNKFDGSQITTSGMAWLPLSPGAPARKIIPASVFGRPVSFEDVAMASSGLGFALVPGNFGGSPNDVVFAFDLLAGTARKIFEGSSGFVLGAMAVIAANNQLIVAHANPARPRLQLLDIANPADIKPLREINSSLQTGLPPVSMAWY